MVSWLTTACKGKIRGYRAGGREEGTMEHNTGDSTGGRPLRADIGPAHHLVPDVLCTLRKPEGAQGLPVVAGGRTDVGDHHRL